MGQIWLPEYLAARLEAEQRAEAEKAALAAEDASAVVVRWTCSAWTVPRFVLELLAAPDLQSQVARAVAGAILHGPSVSQGASGPLAGDYRHDDVTERRAETAGTMPWFTLHAGSRFGIARITSATGVATPAMRGEVRRLAAWHAQCRAAGHTWVRDPIPFEAWVGLGLRLAGAS
jgi:hypothetical protein